LHSHILNNRQAAGLGIRNKTKRSSQYGHAQLDQPLPNSSWEEENGYLSFFLEL